MNKESKFKVGDEVVFVGKSSNPKIQSNPTVFGGVETIDNVDVNSFITSYFIDGLIYYEDEIEFANKEEKPMSTSVVQGVGTDAPTVVNEKGGKQSKVLYRLDLVDPLALLEMGRVLHEGAVKYGEENWRQIPVNDHLNHLLIHVYAYLAGDTSDDHLSHVMCRATFAQAVDITDKKEKLAHVD